MPEAWRVCTANTLVCAAYGAMWGRARSFEGRRVRIPVLAAGAAIWIVPVSSRPLRNRVDLVFAIAATYAFSAACELRDARDRDLLSRWATLALVAAMPVFLLARIPFAHALAFSAASGQAYGAVVTVMALEALFVTVSLPFLRVAMSKERAELEQKKAALTDSLTGVANRRAFFDRGGPLLDWARLPILNWANGTRRSPITMQRIG